MDRRRGGFRRQLRRLSDWRVIGWPLFWLSSVWLLLDAFPAYLRADAQFPATATTVILSVTATQVVTFAILLIAKYSYLRPRIARRHPSWTVGSFALATFLATIVARSVEVTLQPELAQQSAPDLFTHTVFQTTALCVIGVVAVSLREHQADVATLSAAREGLIATRAAGQRAMVEEHDQVDQRVRLLAEKLAATLPGTSAPQAAVILRHAAGDVIRPLSHELALTPPPVTDQQTVEVPYPSWLATLRSIASGPPLIKPAVMAMTMTILASRLTVTGTSPAPAPPTGDGVQVSVDLAGLFRAIAELVIVFAAVWLSARVAVWLLRRFALTSGRSAWRATIVGTLAIAAASQLLIAGAFRVLGTQPPLATAVGHLLFAVPLILVVLVIAVIQTTAARRRAAVAELTRVNSDLQWELHRTNELLWGQRRVLSRWLHGPVQASLNAGAIQVSREQAGAGEVDSALRMFTEVCARTPVESGPRDIRSELAAVRATWAPVCDIAWSVDEDVAERICKDAACASTLTDVVVEGCSNSVIHGGATRIDIDLTADEQRWIRLVLADNGTPTSEPVEGLGTLMLNDVCLSWERTAGSSGTVLDARFPLSGELAGSDEPPSLRDRSPIHQ